jgi:hypothetical protein
VFALIMPGAIAMPGRKVNAAGQKAIVEFTTGAFGAAGFEQKNRYFIGSCYFNVFRFGEPEKGWALIDAAASKGRETFGYALYPFC